MKLEMSTHCDVFVIGSGLAGIQAASKISGCKVMLASSSHTFSGSSFYPGTWGLGLIGPENKQDNNDLKATIEQVGCSMCNPKLVDTLVNGIHQGIEELKEMGVSLKQAVDNTQRQFIPCFDYKNRDWNGLLFGSTKKVFDECLQKQKVERLEYHEVIDIIINDKKQVSGVITLDNNNNVKYIGCKCVIIASGGVGGLFKYRLNTSDSNAMGQYLALKSGATLINVEFMQMMPGFIRPCRNTIYNEKMFQYTKFCYHNQQLFVNDQDQELLTLRSTYGPFTSRLPSKKIDIEIFEHFVNDEAGVIAKHNPQLKNTKIEFIKTYFTWLQEEKNLQIEDPIQLGIFLHAANGGIKIDENAATGIDGLYACGEVTGGMHGADRIGGLSSANGLVFGKIAGQQAQHYVETHSISFAPSIEYLDINYRDAKKQIEKIQDIMFKSAMVVRSQKQLAVALKTIVEIENNLVKTSTNQYKNHRDSYRLQACIVMSKAILQACNLRKESRGSHYRSDFPKQNERYNKPITVTHIKDMTVCFEEE